MNRYEIETPVGQLIFVTAFTKGEARGKGKKLLGYRNRLPVGTIVTDLGEAEVEVKVDGGIDEGKNSVRFV